MFFQQQKEESAVGKEVNEWKKSTQLLHAGQVADPATGARAVPIYQTTSYVFDDAEHAERLFSLAEPGNIYSRIMNPTVDAFEKRMAILEDGVGALATSSGMSAITLTIFNLAEAGDEIVAASNLYGGTYNLFKNTLPKYGIKVHFTDSTDPEAVRKAITPKTKAVFAETIGNPSLNVLDFEAISDVAHEAGVPLIIDGTFGSPAVCRPLQHGADIVIHSATKWIGGHGTTIGGVVVDGGRFEWSKEKFPMFHEPDPGYDGLQYKDLGELAFILKMRVQLMRDIGAAMSPFNAFLLLQGLETLNLRMERHQANALALAEKLQSHPQVEWVSYPGLKDHPAHDLAEQYLSGGYGPVVNFGIKGGRDAGRELIRHVKLWSHVANVGDAKSLIIHPASTTHLQLSDEDLATTGVTPDLVRLSVGLEDIDDLYEALDEALRIASGDHPAEEEPDHLYERMMSSAVLHQPEGSRRKVILNYGSDESVKPFKRLGYRVISESDLTQDSVVDYITANDESAVSRDVLDQYEPLGILYIGE
ncbi:O-acetylhomoserine aminocarboxypropyltransferase/cysteine synthase family protein [Salisediminibacterium selenitireducens]|uniref:O-acetylhomoserine/O-acetylserine sulfhydrylase n=1 Tax=Bacillus selenitireducens (strain ATCC 700615 / DSM 15326 / MLS10) TaxID=439292 RepID=D6XSD9_BACIE|nr:O-acetylhomoserine/O-acetylserine sulfhydrylase [[Bacillus] selenitireducens MLS10]